MKDVSTVRIACGAHKMFLNEPSPLDRYGQLYKIGKRHVEINLYHFYIFWKESINRFKTHTQIKTETPSSPYI